MHQNVAFPRIKCFLFLGKCSCKVPPLTLTFWGRGTPLHTPPTLLDAFSISICPQLPFMKSSIRHSSQIAHTVKDSKWCKTNTQSPKSEHVAGDWWCVSAVKIIDTHSPPFAVVVDLKTSSIRWSVVSSKSHFRYITPNVHELLNRRRAAVIAINNK